MSEHMPIPNPRFSPLRSFSFDYLNLLFLWIVVSYIVHATQYTNYALLSSYPSLNTDVTSIYDYGVNVDYPYNLEYHYVGLAGKIATPYCYFLQ